MKLMAMVLLLFAVVGLSGCAGTPELPQCQGPWTPINSPVEAADET
jgi:hypothetical protein